MLYRIGLVSFLVAGCQGSSTRSGQQGGTGGDAGHGNCGGACPDAGMASDGGMTSDAGMASDGGSGSGRRIAFGAPHTYPGGTGAYFVTAGDLDGDGAVDLVDSCVYNAGSRTEVHLLRGSGTGAFTDVATILTAAPDQTVVSDFSGDGIADIAGLAVDGHGPLPDFYLQGQGNFHYAMSTWGDGRDFNINNSLVSGDFNEDGTLDLVGAYRDGFVMLKMPGFVALQTEPRPADGSGLVAAGDFDGDGHQDVVAENALTHAVSLYRGNGSGTVTWTGDTALPGGENYRLIAADLDRDGRSDVVTLHTDGTASVLYGTSTGFAPAQVVQHVAAYAAWIAAGDFDGDGRLDLAVLDTPPTATATVDVWRNTPAGFTHAVTLTAPGNWSITTGDFNGDGLADIAVPGFDNGVTIYLATR